MGKRKPKRKSSNGAGSIYPELDGWWRVAVSAPKPGGGSRIIKRRARNREQAQHLLAQLLSEHHPCSPNAADLTVRDLLDQWIRHSSAEWKPATLEAYENSRRNLSDIEAVRLRNLSPRFISNWVTAFCDSGVTPSVCRMAYKTLRAAVSYGLRMELLAIDPCRGLKSPKVRRKEIHPFTEPEVAAILSATRLTSKAALYQIALTTGMRQGEIFGLQWQDIDWDKSAVHIRRQAAEVGGELSIEAPKTSSSVRTITLTAATRTALENHLKQSQRRRIIRPADFVFTNVRGGPMRRSNFRRRHWMPLLANQRIKHRGFHHCRHTAATMMLKARVPVHVVGRFLGHSSSEITLRLYAHFVDQDGGLAAGAMAHLGQTGLESRIKTLTETRHTDSPTPDEVIESIIKGIGNSGF